MPSIAFTRWKSGSLRALDEIEAAHRAVAGRGAGRRFARQQIGHAYVVMLSSHFQRFCRDLHSEAADYLMKQLSSAALREVFLNNLVHARKLDSGNPNPGNLGADYARLEMEFWLLVAACDPRTAGRRAKLEELNRWRNAIAHQDFRRVGGHDGVQLTDVRKWRAACEALAVAFDNAVRRHLTSLVGVAPW